jgi:hypothetical protein
LINQEFPLIDVPARDWRGPLHIVPEVGMEILILTGFRDTKMAELSKRLREKGLRFEIVQDIGFNHGFAKFDVLKIKLFHIGYGGKA